ncbi:MAG: DUF11 domain-containing protein [Proteobacteria bacterium]|nr:DUF11 domain-containing protein [Pseudomonadota bacterium]
MKLKLIFLILFTLISNGLYAATISFGPNGCTLQDAIRSANTDSAVGNCSAGSGSDVLVAPDVWNKTLNSVLPTITSDMTIRTATASGLLEIYGDANRIFRVTGNNTNFTLQRVRLRRGGATSAINAGGAMRIINASVNIQDSFFVENRSYVGKGGAIFIRDGELTIDNTEFYRNGTFNTGNIDIPFGGAIYAKDSILDIDQSNFLLNEAKYGFSSRLLIYEQRGQGASIFMDGGELNINASLFRENNTGISANGAVATIINSTFLRIGTNYIFVKRLIDFKDSSVLTLNHVTMATPVLVQDSILIMTNSILRGECLFSSADWIIDVGNIYNTQGNVCIGNLFDSPRMLELTDNGGPTLTFALHHTSDAINAGDPNYCLATDQRGEARDASCDIGAFEVTGLADVEVSANFMQNAPYVSAQEVIYNLKIKNNGPAFATSVEVDIDTSNIYITQTNSTLCSSFPCVISSIQPNQEITIPVAMTVGNFNSIFSISASANTTVSSLYTDFDLDNNITTTLNWSINRGSDMGVVMDLLTSEPYFIGQSITYEATINNYGQQTANVVELEFVPTNLNNVVFQNCISSSGQVCNYQNLLNGGSGVVTIKADITAAFFDASAEVSSAFIDVNNSNNIDDTQNNGSVNQADISIEVNTVQLPSYYADQYLQFNVEISNGDKQASNIRIYSDFPGAFYIGPDGCSSPLGSSFACIIPLMAANSVQTITLSYFAPIVSGTMGRLFKHHILVTPAQTDPNMSDNEVNIQLPISSAADVLANLTLTTMPPYLAGQSVQYELLIVNGGVSHATDVDIALIPENLTLIWASSDNCVTVDCNLANLDRFQREDITLVYEINSSGSFDLTATVNANEVDIYPNNNIDDSDNGGTVASIQSGLMFSDGFE